MFTGPGVPPEDYDEDIHAYCGKCGIILLIESMQCPLEGEGLFCEGCSGELLALEEVIQKGVSMT